MNLVIMWLGDIGHATHLKSFWVNAILITFTVLILFVQNHIFILKLKMTIYLFLEIFIIFQIVNDFLITLISYSIEPFYARS